MLRCPGSLPPRSRGAARTEAEQGCAESIVTHDVKRQLELADQVMAVADGRVVIDAPRHAVGRDMLAAALHAPLT